jgi:hypothetical protein
MNNKKLIGMFSLALVALLSVSLVSAQCGGYNEDAKSAIEDNDFDAWKEAVIATLTPENFGLIVERHESGRQLEGVGLRIRNAWSAGSKEEVAELKEEYRALEAKAKDMTVEEYNEAILKMKAEAKGLTVEEYETLHSQKKGNCEREATLKMIESGEITQEEGEEKLASLSCNGAGKKGSFKGMNEASPEDKARMHEKSFWKRLRFW